MSGYGFEFPDDPADDDKKTPSPVRKPVAADDKDARMCTTPERENFENACDSSPEPEQKALPPSTRSGPKEPTPGQVAEWPASGNIDDAKFKDTTAEENYPLHVETLVPVSPTKRDRAGGYGFGSHKPVSKQERGGSEQEYKPAVTERRLGKAPGPPPDSGRIVELPDRDEPGGSGGEDAPGGSGAGGAAGGSQTGGAPGGGDAPPAV